MAEVGQVLRRKREELGLSLDEIQTKTKIRKRYLEAIEAEDWAVLPGKVYARGFIRSYADALGLDGFQLLNQLDGPSYAAEDSPQNSNETGEIGTNQDTHSSQESNTQKGSAMSSERTTGSFDGKKRAENENSGGSNAEPRKRSRPSLLVNTGSVKETLRRTRKPKRGGTGVPVGQIATVVIGLGILGAGWWVLYHRGNTAANTTADTAANQQANTASASGQKTDQKTGNTTGNKTSTPPKPVLTVTSKPYDSTAGTQTYIVSAAKQLSVKMQAQPACWMRIIKLDKNSGSPSGMTIQPKQPKTWSANNLVYIRLGHVHGVTLSVDGKTVKLPTVNHPIDVMFKKSSKS